MNQVTVLREAAEDVKSAREFYESQADGLGDEFAVSLMADIESLQKFHGLHAVKFGYHRMLATRFPFGIYYQADGGNRLIVAVLDLRRDPLRLVKVLKNR